MHNPQGPACLLIITGGTALCPNLQEMVPNRRCPYKAPTPAYVEAEVD